MSEKRSRALQKSSTQAEEPKKSTAIELTPKGLFVAEIQANGSLKVVAQIHDRPKGQPYKVAFRNWFRNNAKEGKPYVPVTCECKPMQGKLVYTMVPE